MRTKIVLVNGGIIVVLSLVIFFLLRSSLEGALAQPAERRRELSRGLQAAEARLTLDALRTERWLDRMTSLPGVAEVFASGTAAARSEAATAEANRLRDAAVADPEFAKMAPSLVLFVDAEGVTLGRNGSQLMRGDRLGAAYPGLLAALRQQQTGSEFWVNAERQEQMLVAYAPVRLAQGELAGAIVLGTPLNDERMKRTSELTYGGTLGLIVGPGSAPLALTAGDRAAFSSTAVVECVGAARKGAVGYASTPVAGSLYAARGVSGFGGDAVLVAAIAASPRGSIDALLWPIFAVGALGLLLVFVSGTLLGNYISRPIAEIEDGLLSIMNGERDLRFDLEHAELGGLTSRMNALLNTLLGVAEAETEAEAPGPSNDASRDE